MSVIHSFVCEAKVIQNPNGIKVQVNIRTTLDSML